MNARIREDMVKERVSINANPDLEKSLGFKAKASLGVILTAYFKMDFRQATTDERKS